LHYVALGSSIPLGVGASRESYVTHYAQYLEADLDVKVQVHNWAVAGLTSEALLRDVRTLRSMRETLGDADVITVWIGGNDMRRLLDGPCGTLQDMDLGCLREGVMALEANVDALLTAILSLRGTNNTLVLIADLHNVWVDEWKEAGVFQKLKGPGFEDWSHAIAHAAARQNIPVVPTYAALNSPTGDEEIPGQYLLPDGVHLSEEGHILVAGLHRDLGYEPIAP
jgi:lysophospholipase L1-like esterase